jgi:hypothetical protein
MPRDWESVCSTWTKASSDTECDKQENAERMIRDAINAYSPLASRDIKIIPQGSYRNNTNVRQESDVDICVCCMEPFFDDYSMARYGRAESGVVHASYYPYAQFKNEVGAALINKFGALGVHRGDKAFDVHANTYRVDADVVAAFAHRRYEEAVSGPLPGMFIRNWIKPEGTQFYADSGGAAIVNWPEQQYRNGVAKNTAIGNRFKWATRVLKNFKYDMEANGNADQKKAAKEAPSYLCECLMFNVPDFIGNSPRKYVRNAIVYAHRETKLDGGWNEWAEVNDLKYLFRGIHAWTREQANTFLLRVWQYGEFS